MAKVCFGSLPGCTRSDMASTDGDYLPLISPDDHEDREETERRTSSVSNRFVLILAGVAAVASVANFAAQRQPQDTMSKAGASATTMQVRSTQTMHFSVETEYGETKYGTMHPWIDNKPVVEPYRQTTLKASGPAMTGDESLRWVIEGVDEVTYGSQANKTDSRHNAANAALNIEPSQIDTLAAPLMAQIEQ